MDYFSMYDPLWNALKKDHTVSVTAHRAHHARIEKAVRKRKWLDLGYKVEIDPMIATLHAARNHAILTLRLEFRKRPVDFKQFTVEHI